MKSQDIVLLFKLVSIGAGAAAQESFAISPWRDWEESKVDNAPFTIGEPSFEDTDLISKADEQLAQQYGVRALSAMTGISKSQVSLALIRCRDVGLMAVDRSSGAPRVNTAALAEFVIYGLKYIFPARPGPLARGIATASDAPVLRGVIASGGDQIVVWPDAMGNTKGQALEPLYKTVPLAVRRDPLLYSLCALTDSIRIGRARERAVASDALNKILLAANV